MDQSATSVWRTARSHVDGLPKCPEDMSEPAYAHLVFDVFCNVCTHTLLRLNSQLMPFPSGVPTVSLPKTRIYIQCILGAARAIVQRMRRDHVRSYLYPKV